MTPYLPNGEKNPEYWNAGAFMKIIEHFMTDERFAFERRKERALARIKQEHTRTLHGNHLKWEDVPKTIHIEETDPVLKKLAFLWGIFTVIEKATE